MRVPVIAAIKQADDSKRGSPVACDIGGQTPNTWVNYAVPYALGAVPVIVENNSCVEEQYGAIEIEKRHRACMKK